MAYKEALLLEVKTISTQMIKPSTPTPLHLKTYTLSFVDQIHPQYYTLMLLFYPKTTHTPPTSTLDMDLLKNSLSKTLSKFYPLAGRFHDNFTISCTDQGIPFIETRVNYLLSDFLALPNKVDLLYKLTPPQELKAEMALPKRVPLALQVNVFSCGGFVLGCLCFQKFLLDGTSFVTFLKHWASIVTGKGVPITPDFDTTRFAFPPRPTLSWQPFDTPCSQNEGVRVVAKSFIFTKHAIIDVRNKAASKEVPNPSRVEALAGFVWEHCMAAAYAAGTMSAGPEPSVVSLLVNMRPRVQPPLTPASMGNLLTTVSVRATDEMVLQDLVREIHESISNVSERIKYYKGGENVNALVADVAPISGNKPGTYGISSWCQFRLDEVDFGFGGPQWATPSDGIENSSSRNYIHFVVDNNTDGIEVWLFLEENEMRHLESNKYFLALAYPNTSYVRRTIVRALC